MFYFLLQIPTPTPLPDMSVNAPIQIPDMSLWDFAPDAIQTWNSIETKSGLMTLLQVILLILIIIGIAGFIMFAVSQVTKD